MPSRSPTTPAASTGPIAPGATTLGPARNAVGAGDGIDPVAGTGSTGASATTPPPVDVVILTWNDGELLDRAVASCRASVGVDVRLIIVDNGSSPPAEVDGPVTLIRNDVNRGVAAGRNQGIAAGTSPFVCLLDSDAELRPGSLARLVDELASTGAALVVPVFEDQAPEASAGRAPNAGRKVARMLGRSGRYAPSPGRHPGAGSWPVEFGIGACQVFHRAGWSEVGGIDESFFYGPEDVDFCLRILDAGGTVRQVAAAPVLHPPRRRHRRPVDTAGLRHGWAIVRYLVRHRRRLHGRLHGRLHHRPAGNGTAR
ncbi:MAG: glycosyltransferase family 2 protein [Acidimicrobiales bacterium]